MRYFQRNLKDKSKYVPEGVGGEWNTWKCFKNYLSITRRTFVPQWDILEQAILIKLKSTKFIKITKAGFYESMVHSVEMTKKTINYKL